jgi:Flp pilus assembly protein TadG
MLSSFARQIARFRRDQRGNVLMLFAITIVPVLAGVGAAVDYSRVDKIRTRLQLAIDSASVGSVAKDSPAFIAAGSMTSDGPIQAGMDDAKRIFDGNMVGQTGYTLINTNNNQYNPVVAVTKTAGTVTSSLQFTATVPTIFMGMFGMSSLSSMTVTGTSNALATMPQYIDFYLLLDNSPSMGIGATQTDIDNLVSATASKSQDDHCAFACHDLSGASDYYTLAKNKGITTRIDVLRSATQQLMDTAAATATYSNQFRMAIYDFGGTIQSASLRPLYALSADLGGAKTAAGNIDLMTVRWQNDNNDQGTAFSTLIPAIGTVLGSTGTGSSATPLKYLFFVSDGFADEKNSSCIVTMKNTNWGDQTPRCQSPIDPTLCKALKDKGIKIAVLYTTYGLVPMLDKNNKPTWYNSWVSPYNGGATGPTPTSPIATNMQACASPGFYFEVSPTQGIADAMNTLFRKAVADARISG